MTSSRPDAGSPGTVSPLLSEVAATPFISSWIGRARPGDVRDPDPGRRTAALAHHALCRLAPMTGSHNRPYRALLLDGRFYNPHGNGPDLPPHIEIPAHLFSRSDPDFPDRYAALGNGLAFTWWLVSEVLAVKRVLFAGAATSPGSLTDLLNSRHTVLVDAVTELTRRAGEVWAAVEDGLVADPDTLAEIAAGDFTTDQVGSFWPAGAAFGLQVRFDAKLKDQNGSWVSRRVGVWQISGIDPDTGEPVVLGVITPRLTRSSTFTDDLFAPNTESAAALLVRGLVLSRLCAHFGAGTSRVGEPAPVRVPGQGLRAVVARVGEKIPEASVAAAVKFLRHHPDPHDAWASLSAWANGRGPGSDGQQRRAALTVSEDGYVAAHRSASRAVRRAEEPDRDDINVLLPLAWDTSNRVVRVTYHAPD